MWAGHEHQRRNNQAQSRGIRPAQTDGQAAKRRANPDPPRKGGVKSSTGNLATSCRESKRQGGTPEPLTRMAPASARNSQAMAEAASPKRDGDDPAGVPRSDPLHGFQAPGGLVDADAIEAQRINHTRCPHARPRR